MKQASRFDGLSFDPFSLFQNGLATSEVDVGRREVLQALVITPVIVVIDEGVDLLSEIARKIVVFQQDAVLEGLVPTLDFALGLRVIPSRRHNSAMLSSPFRPSNTILIFSPAEYCLRVARRMSLTTFSPWLFRVPDFCLISNP